MDRAFTRMGKLAAGLPKMLVKNTFLEVPEDDPCMTPVLRRQNSDSIIERVSRHRQELEDDSAQVLGEVAGRDDVRSDGLQSPSGKWGQVCGSDSALGCTPSYGVPAEVRSKAHASCSTPPSGVTVEEELPTPSTCYSTGSENSAHEAELSPRHCADEEVFVGQLTFEPQSPQDGSGEALSESTLLPGCTTVMIRHIPTKYTQRRLVREINHAGFAGQYDFLYLPMDGRSQSNRGFAFVNFLTPDLAQAFYGAFNGRRLRHLNSVKVATVGTAHLQGLEENAANFAAALALGRRRAPTHRPLFLMQGHDRRTHEQCLAALSPGVAAAASLAYTAPSACHESGLTCQYCSLCGHVREPPEAPFCTGCGAPSTA